MTVRAVSLRLIACAALVALAAVGCVLTVGLDDKSCDDGHPCADRFVCVDGTCRLDDATGEGEGEGDVGEGEGDVGEGEGEGDVGEGEGEGEGDVEGEGEGEGDVWQCDPRYQGANDGCDCGCGAVDPDCGSGGCTAPSCFVPTCGFCNDASFNEIPCGVDPCTAATTSTVGPASGNTSDAGHLRSALACGPDHAGADVVLVSPPQSGTLRLALTSTPDMILGARANCGGPPELLCEDDAGSSGLEVGWLDVNAGSDVSIIAGNFGLQFGAWSLDMRYAQCGDGVVDLHEGCEDGNTASGDGCAACQFEGATAEIEPNDDGTPSRGNSDFDDQAVIHALANGTFSSNARVAARLLPSGDEDVFPIGNTSAAPVQVTLRTRDGLLPNTACSDDFDTKIVVRRADGTSVAENNDLSGSDNCSRVVVTLAPGETLFAVVQHAFDSRAVISYLLEITFG